MEEPLRHYYKIYSFEKSHILKLVSEEKYTGVMLKNGQIGVCANLGNKVDVDLSNSFALDLRIVSHRILYNAYLNALINIEKGDERNTDIFDSIDFNKYNNIVMIGYFKPVIEKFVKASIDLKIFDLFHNNELTTPIEQRAAYVKNADTILLSATSIFNNSFFDISQNSNDSCDIFLLGPSAILHNDILKYNNIKSIFGTSFEKNDVRVLNSIAEGHGTRHFQKFGKKVKYEFQGN